MSEMPRPTHTQPVGFVVGPEEMDDPVVNDSLGTVVTADSTGLDEDMETGDARALNFPTHED